MQKATHLIDTTINSKKAISIKSLGPFGGYNIRLSKCIEPYLNY